MLMVALARRAQWLNNGGVVFEHVAVQLLGHHLVRQDLPDPSIPPILGEMDDVVNIEDVDSEFNSSQETLPLRGAMTGFSFAAGASSPRGVVVRSPSSSPRGVQMLQKSQDACSHGEPVAADPYARDLRPCSSFPPSYYSPILFQLVAGQSRDSCRLPS